MHGLGRRSLSNSSYSQGNKISTYLYSLHFVLSPSHYREVLIIPGSVVGALVQVLGSLAHVARLFSTADFVLSDAFVTTFLSKSRHFGEIRLCVTITCENHVYLRL